MIGPSRLVPPPSCVCVGGGGGGGVNIKQDLVCNVDCAIWLYMYTTGQVCLWTSEQWNQVKKPTMAFLKISSTLFDNYNTLLNLITFSTSMSRSLSTMTVRGLSLVSRIRSHEWCRVSSWARTLLPPNLPPSTCAFTMVSSKHSFSVAGRGRIIGQESCVKIRIQYCTKAYM